MIGIDIDDWITCSCRVSRTKSNRSSARSHNMTPFQSFVPNGILESCLLRFYSETIIAWETACRITWATTNTALIFLARHWVKSRVAVKFVRELWIDVKLFRLMKFQTCKLYSFSLYMFFSLFFLHLVHLILYIVEVITKLFLVYEFFFLKKSVHSHFLEHWFKVLFFPLFVKIIVGLFKFVCFSCFPTLFYLLVKLFLLEFYSLVKDILSCFLMLCGFLDQVRFLQLCEHFSILFFDFLFVFNVVLAPDGRDAILSIDSPDRCAFLWIS